MKTQHTHKQLGFKSKKSKNTFVAENFFFHLLMIIATIFIFFIFLVDVKMKHTHKKNRKKIYLLCRTYGFFFFPDDFILFIWFCTRFSRTRTHTHTNITI